MIIFVPAREKGRGGGHLVRCTKFISELQALGKDTVLYEPTDYTDLHGLNIDLVILDRFQTQEDELKKWKALAPVIGIDEGGASRDEFDFLIDILPNLEKIKPNISDIGLLPLPNNLTQRRRLQANEGAEDAKKILISFGLEDSAGLGEKVAHALVKNNYSKNYEITWLQSSAKTSLSPLPIPRSPFPNLAEHLHEYDLVITHFGITAFEAAYAGTPVLLLNPTTYHEKLARKAGFCTTTEKKIKSYPLHSSAPSFACKRRLCARKIEPRSLAKLIASFSPQINRVCPVCGANLPKRTLARIPDRTYRKCAKCGIIFMDRLTPAPITYGKEYFFEEYKKQYGKTYLEDFENLKTIAKRRLKIINSLNCSLLTAHCSLLDIGCAYGAFLAAAKEEGLKPYGIDPCKEAAEYVKEKIGINVTHGLFPHSSFLIPHSSFNVITLWFTLEHFHNCQIVFKEIKSRLAPCGILAFSTPSFSGISGRKNLCRFLEKSPADHFTIWSPNTCRKALKLNGFKVKKIINCGHHPERFPILGKLARCKKSPLYWILLAISRLFKLGDTFEVYAVNSQSYEK